MKVKRLTQLALISLLVMASILIMNCVPPSGDAGETEQLGVAEKARQDSLRDVKCDLYLSFAYSYYQNQDWRGAIENYKKMIDAGCEETRAQDIFPYYGRAYQQLATDDPNYLDSALFVYIEGEQYLPDDIFLHKNIAYIYQLQGKTDLEIREYEKMVEIDPDNIDLYRRLVRLNFTAERYDDVLLFINEILRLSPNDEQAINDRITAYEKLGKDITTVQKEQWEQNRGNVRYGLEYAQALADQFMYDEAIDVYTQVTGLDLKNREAWEKLAEIYTTVDRSEDALKAYTHINKNIAPRDITVIDKIARTLRRVGRYDQAYEWAKKALDIEKTATTYKMMADVYFDAAENSSGSRQLNFEDKLVYKLAYDYYKKAQEKGDYGVKSRIDFLTEYLIPTNEDWFMNRYDANGNSRQSYRPNLPCYSWVVEEARKN